MKQLLGNFFFRLAIVLLLFACLLTLLVGSYWLWAVICFFILCLSVKWLYRLYIQNIHNIELLLEAVDNNDATIRFNEHTDYSKESYVNQMLNRIATILYNTKQNIAQREKYYELILNFVDTAVVVLNHKGFVYQKNKEALRLLELNVFVNVKQLNKVSLQLMQAFQDIMPGESKQVQLNNERGTMNLLLKASSITIKNEELKIIAFNDIQTELDENEIDSWIHLIRILTHEIMNSLTPITSLSESLLRQQHTENEIVKQGLETINSTGQGLIAFVSSYRKLTRIPSPTPSLFYIRPFLERMILLAQHQLDCSNISIQIQKADKELIVYADENLISQVVINLLKNAVQAVESNSNGVIVINAYCDKQERVVIEISNNGARIPLDISQQIFIPFFTTKENGNGVGLSVSKHIMRLSNGSLKLSPYRTENSFTTFVLTFN